QVDVEVKDAEQNRTIHGSVEDAAGLVFEVEAEAPFRDSAVRVVPSPLFKTRFLTVDHLGSITGTLFDFAFQMVETSFTHGIGVAEIEVDFPTTKKQVKQVRLPHGQLPVEVPARINFTMIDGSQIFFQQLPGQ